VITAAAALVAPASALAHPVAPSHFVETAKPYAPYEFLIGDWYSKLGAENMRIHQRFEWGPGHSYINYATILEMPGKPEHLHFQGMMVWNGKAKALDFLFAVEPGSGVEEKGTVAVQPDGSVVREVELTDGEGKGERFRQSFRKGEGGAVVTTLSQLTDKGWRLNPPGEIVMTRR
jgi:hypothetical protein